MGELKRAAVRLAGQLHERWSMSPILGAEGVTVSLSGRTTGQATFAGSCLGEAAARALPGLPSGLRPRRDAETEAYFRALDKSIEDGTWETGVAGVGRDDVDGAAPEEPVEVMGGPEEPVAPPSSLPRIEVQDDAREDRGVGRGPSGLEGPSAWVLSPVQCPAIPDPLPEEVAHEGEARFTNEDASPGAQWRGKDNTGGDITSAGTEVAEWWSAGGRR